MKSKTILGADGATKMRQITVGIHGKGGEAGITAAIANALTAYAKTADVTKAINAAVAGLIQLDDLSVASTGAGNVVTGLAYDNKTGKFTVTKGLTALTEADFTEITQQEVKAMFA